MLIFPRVVLVLQVVSDITACYMQTYNKYKTSGDESLKKILQLIQDGVSHVCSTSASFSFQSHIVIESDFQRKASQEVHSITCSESKAGGSISCLCVEIDLGGVQMGKQHAPEKPY